MVDRLSKDCQTYVEGMYTRSMAVTPDAAHVRIGELARRVGVSEHVLRAWETRYGLLRPQRSAGGFRLYSAADEQRVRRMQQYMTDGLSAAQAARSALAETPDGSASGSDAGLAIVEPEALRRVLADSLDAFDEPNAQVLFDRMLAGLSLPTVLRDVVLPYLAELGERWESGEISVAQEHFASNVLRGRIAGLGRDWGNGYGPRALLACAPNEQHELALMMFGVTLHRNGWRVGYLGPNTPLSELAATVDAAAPDLVVVSATLPETLEPHRRALRGIARRVPLALGGPAVTDKLAKAIGARHLADDPVSAAEALAATW
jgi:methanogenic corrinoid protein MtbC1